MIERITSRLENLTLAVGVIRIEDAIRIIDIVNRRIQELLSCEVIRVYWQSEAEKGVILKPVTFVNKTSRDDPMFFTVTSKIDGMISWVYNKKEPIWFEKIRSKDINNGITNLASGKKITGKNLGFGFRYDVDSVMAVPLSASGNIYGVYTIELGRSGVLNNQVLGLLESICKPIARVLSNATHYEKDKSDTSQALRNFLNEIQNERFSRNILIGKKISGFMARPFRDHNFKRVEDAIKKVLKKSEIDLKHVKPTGDEVVIRQVIDQIESSSFCIADITGGNPNVFAEVGMMMAFRKRFMMIRKKDDTTNRPFNVASYNIFDYEIVNNEVRIWESGNSASVPLDKVINDFVTLQ